MANVFDRFDEPAERKAPQATGPAEAGNVFDQFDAAKPAKKVGNINKAAAVAAGVNKGFYSDLLGLPVDTIQNVIDLGKAGYGTVVTAAGRPDLAPEVATDRSGIVGTSDWIAKKINQGSSAIGVNSPINNPNPNDQASRVLYQGGRVAGASVVPSPKVPIGPMQQLVNVGGGLVSGTLAGQVAESHPEWAGVASMVPQVALAAGNAAVKSSIRGGEAGRRNMEQRIQDFKNAGVDEPSAGLASGNRLVQGVENLLSLTPGSVGVFEKSKQRMIGGMQAKTNQLRDDISPIYGPVEAGAAIQADLKGAFKDRVGNTYGLLNDKVEQVVGPNTPVPVNESILKSAQLTTPIPGAEATSSNFINGRIAKISSDLATDAGGKPAQTVYVGGQTVQIPAGHGTKTVQQPGLLDASGAPIVRVIPGTQPQGVPFAALKDLRTKIGKEAASNAIMGTPEQADFKQLYGAMSQDMKNGVALADMQNGVMPTDAGSATTALNRANTYYSRAMTRADALNPIANRATPEGTYNAVAKSLEAGPTTYERVRNAVTPEARRQFAATVIDDLGKATPGQQGAAGDTWSPRTFLTNYNKLDSQARQELFKRLPGGQKHAEDLAAIAKAADMVGESSKVWANPSGTGAALAARGAFGAIGVGALFDPLKAAGAAGGLAAGNAVSRLLVSPIFVNWLAKAPKEMTPQRMQAYTQRLVANAKLAKDQQLQQDVDAYLQSVEQGLNVGNDADQR